MIISIYRYKHDDRTDVHDISHSKKSIEEIKESAKSNNENKASYIQNVLDSIDYLKEQVSEDN